MKIDRTLLRLKMILHCRKSKQQELIAEWNRRQHGIIESSRKTYEWAIENGIAKERTSCSPTRRTNQD